MSSPQLKNGYTPVANEILEQVYKLKLNGTQFKIIMVVWRFTYGFSRREHELSETFISKATDIHKKQISRELNQLIKYNIITVERVATFTRPRIVSFNKNYSQWILNNRQATKTLPPNELINATANELVTTTGSELVTQENNNKTNIKQSVSVSPNEEELKKNFEIIYSLYPKKTTRQSAYESYKKWIKGKKVGNEKVKLTNRQIYIAVSVYVKEKEDAKADLQYYKNFSTLMNQILDYVVEEGEEDAG